MEEGGHILPPAGGERQAAGQPGHSAWLAQPCQ